MDFETTILHYQTMQAVAEQMAKNINPHVTWVTGEYLRDTLWDSDIRVDVDGDTMSFEGETWSVGEMRDFAFTIPVEPFMAAVEARLAVMA
jgi:hypothetical protein